MNQCNGITLKSNRCGKKIKSGKYCHIHATQELVSKTKILKHESVTKTNIKSEFDCTICSETKSHSTIFSCGHEICNTCIDNLNLFSCPFCKDIRDEISNITKSKINHNIEQENHIEYTSLREQIYLLEQSIEFLRNSINTLRIH